MKTKHMILMACMAMLTTPAVFGRLGETLEQCTARYGESFQSPPGKAHFAKDGYDIHCEFRADGVCWSINYTHRDSSPLTVQEVEALLALNGTKWAAGTPEGEWISYHGEPDVSGSLHNHKSLGISYNKDSEAFYEKRQADAAAKAKDKTKGL
jgi:hypothetical protein